MARRLKESLDSIEETSATFLVKPACSYQSKGANSPPKTPNGGQRVTPLLHRANSERNLHRGELSQAHTSGLRSNLQIKSPPVANKRAPTLASWHAQDSVAPQVTDENNSNKLPHIGGTPQTPKVLELDINRMILPQSQIS